MICFYHATEICKTIPIKPQELCVFITPTVNRNITICQFAWNFFHTFLNKSMNKFSIVSRNIPWWHWCMQVLDRILSWLEANSFTINPLVYEWAIYVTDQFCYWLTLILPKPWKTYIQVILHQNPSCNHQKMHSFLELSALINRCVPNITTTIVNKQRSHAKTYDNDPNVIKTNMQNIFTVNSMHWCELILPLTSLIKFTWTPKLVESLLNNMNNHGLLHIQYWIELPMATMVSLQDMHLPNFLGCLEKMFQQPLKIHKVMSFTI